MAVTYNIILNSGCHFYRLQAVAMFSPLSGIFPANFDPGQPWPGQAGLAARPRLPRFFYPLASPAKARPLAVLTPAFRPGFDPGLPRSGQAPDARGWPVGYVSIHEYYVTSVDVWDWRDDKSQTATTQSHN